MIRKSLYTLHTDTISFPNSLGLFLGESAEVKFMDTEV